MGKLLIKSIKEGGFVPHIPPYKNPPLKIISKKVKL